METGRKKAPGRALSLPRRIQQLEDYLSSPPTDWTAIYWELAGSCLGHDSRFAFDQFAFQSTELIFSALDHSRRLLRQQSIPFQLAIAQYAVDYFYSQSTDSPPLPISRYLPIDQPPHPLSDTEREIVRNCKEKGLIPVKFLLLIQEDI